MPLNDCKKIRLKQTIDGANKASCITNYLSDFSRLNPAVLYEPQLLVVTALLQEVIVGNTASRIGYLAQAEEKVRKIQSKDAGSTNHYLHSDSRLAWGFALMLAGKQKPALTVLEETMTSHDVTVGLKLLANSSKDFIDRKLHVPVVFRIVEKFISEKTVLMANLVVDGSSTVKGYSDYERLKEELRKADDEGYRLVGFPGVYTFLTSHN